LPFVGWATGGRDAVVAGHNCGSGLRDAVEGGGAVEVVVEVVVMSVVRADGAIVN
jgi:hypothetical protein